MTGMPFKRTAGIYKPNSNMPNLPLPQCMLCVRFVFLRRELSLSARGRAHTQRVSERERERESERERDREHSAAVSISTE